MSTLATAGLAAEPDADTVPLPHPVKQKIKDALVALSLANLVFLRPTFDLLFDGDRFYDRFLLSNTDLLALLCNIFGAAMVIWLGLRVAHRFRNRWLQLVLHLAFFSLLLIPADLIRTKFYGVPDYRVLMFFKQPMVMLGSVVLLALVLWQHRRLAIAVANLLGILSAFALVIVAKVVLLMLGVNHPQQCDRGTLAPLLPVQAGQPRVIWMIFDETDYRLAFAQRPAGVTMPEFDRLMQETLHADHAYPPGDATLFSMPPAILGRRAGVWPVGCDLQVTLFDTGQTTTFNQLPNVFFDARRLGFNTAVLGWFVPYDRLLSGQLNFCQWYAWPPFESARAAAFPQAFRNQLTSVVWPLDMRQIYADLCQDSLHTAVALSTNTDYGLTLLHLPPPHRPGIYSATKHKVSIWDTIFRMSATKGYFNNLTLADNELGEIRRTMEAAGQWDKTWIIVSADHSWRSSADFDGHRDFRVPFFVKPPGPANPVLYSQQFNTILTHDLILAILRGQLANQQNVVDWLDAHRNEQNFIPEKSGIE